MHTASRFRALTGEPFAPLPTATNMHRNRRLNLLRLSALDIPRGSHGGNGKDGSACSLSEWTIDARCRDKYIQHEGEYWFGFSVRTSLSANNHVLILPIHHVTSAMRSLTNLEAIALMCTPQMYIPETVAKGIISRQRDSHSAASPSPFSRCFSRD